MISAKIIQRRQTSGIGYNYGMTSDYQMTAEHRGYGTGT